MTRKRWQKQWSFMLAAAFAVSLAACSGGGGGGSSSTSTTTTSTTSTTVNGSAATATATVSGTGTTGATTVTGISTAEKISVVGSSTTTGKPEVKGLKMISSLLGLTVTLPSTWTSSVDYYKDPQFVYTHERGDETLNTPNEILCQISQLKADKMVNRGAYRAQVDKNKCSSSKDSKSNAGSANSGQQQGSTNAPDYENWTVLSNRADDTSPHVVAAWVHTTMGGPQGEQPAVIYAKATMSESPSTTNPYGMFTMSFKAYPETNGVADTTKELMHGLLRTVKLTSNNNVVLQFFNAQTESKGGQSFSFNFATAVTRAADGSTGSATSSFPEFDKVCSQTGCDFSSLTNTVWNMAYNSTLYARVPVVSGTADSTKLVCMDKANKVKAAWRYGLYKSDGSRKTLNSGFPIRYVDTSNASHEGFVGYWGLWINDGTSVPNGATVKKQSWSGTTAAEEEYLYKKTKGRLIKHTNKKTTLDKIKNVKLSYWDQTASQSKELKWDGTHFTITGVQGTSGITQVAANTYLDVSALSWSSTLFMWSQSLGGTVIIELPVSGTTVSGTTITSSNGCVKSGGWNSTTSIWTNETFNCTAALTAPALARVTYLKEDIIMPDGKLADGTAVTVPTLTCYENCPKGSQFASGTTGSVFYPRDFNLQDGVTAYTYTWDSANYVLKDGSSEIDLSKGSAAASNTALTGDWGPLTWGLNTGVLFNNNSTNQALMKCPWDTTQICAWQAQQVLSEFYTWQTGPEDWNVLTALLGPKATTPTVAVPFDQPIDVNFSYPTEATGVNPAAVDTKYTGVPFRLQYGGFGDLWGIPGHCVDGETGSDIDCWTNGGKWVRYIPEFTIPDGVTVTDEASTPNTYYVKALEVEESMIGLSQSACSSLSLTTLTLPAETDYTAPDIGTEPTVTDAPAVIGGVVQRTL
ncbi:MAG: hypothetical protein HZA04_05620 [Nitrospinae bacterium]|nr:hypothetical protein [Nitrospinota bacterium]